MFQTNVDREDYSHPEKIYKDLIFAPNGKVPDEICKHDKRFEDSRPATDQSEILCWSCGWNVYHELHASYGSRIRIFHTRGNMGIWEVGSRWLIRDQPNDASAGNDFITQEFLRKQPNLDIPLVKEMRRLSFPTDKVQITLMSRAEGIGLDKIWHTLSLEQQMNYKDQLSDAIKKWRRFTSPVAGKVDGGPLDDPIIGYCARRYPPTCKKIGRTTDEWFKNIEKELRHGLSLIHKTKDPAVIEKFRDLKENFPKSEPYVLTHGDLNFTNIIVKDDKIEAIIDWEFSGYFPWWVERWISLIGGQPATNELFDPLWADPDWGMDEDTFHREVIKKVAPVCKAWKACKFYIEHPHTRDQWLRPLFCECKPFGGVFQWGEIGNEAEHLLRDTKLPFI